MSEDNKKPKIQDKELAKKLLELSRSSNSEPPKKKEFAPLPEQEIPVNQNQADLKTQASQVPAKNSQKTKVENGKIINNDALDKFIEDLVKE